MQRIEKHVWKFLKLAEFTTTQLTEQAMDEEQNLGVANYLVNNGSGYENYNVYTTVYGYQGQ